MTACSTAPFIKVESNPVAADVEIVLPGQSPKKIGQTPLNLDDSSLGGSNKMVQVIVSTKGFSSQSVTIPASQFGRNGNIFVDLEKQQLPQACLNQELSLNKVTRGVAEAYNHITQKRLEQAEAVLTNLTLEFPSNSVLHDLLGNVYYLKKDLTRALETYKKSAQLNPANNETTRMIQKIETLRRDR